MEGTSWPSRRRLLAAGALALAAPHALGLVIPKSVLARADEVIE